MKNYILISQPTIQLIGPFESEDVACQYGDRWQLENDDCPFWNTVLHDGSPILPIPAPL